ncbi:DUF6538 domain-containing protein [Burkholderia sp. 22PA0106]|uniref:DUF6538 domain-containing protein n=1 Tax=Burkholderia sp. 22PA0106 TaxID=3237371 RepID=UPI0039C08F0B
MQVIPNTQKRGNVYYFRRKVPVDLLPHYPRKEILLSLGTTDYATAKTRASEMTARTDREFAALRGVTDKEWTPPENFASFHLSQTEQENADGWEAEQAANPEYHEAVRAGQRRAKKSTDRLLEASGLPSTEQLALSQVAAQARAITGAHAPIKPATVVREVTRLDAPQGIWNLRHVIPSWTRRNAPKRPAIDTTNKAIALFEEACGVVPLRQLTKAHGAKFVAYLLDTPARKFKAKTAANHAASVTALLNVAVKDDLIDRNPMDLTFDKSVGAATRGPWTAAQLLTIYGHPLFSGGMDAVPEWMDVKPTDGRALLLLLLHTGARIGELAQLRRGDFLTQDGIAAIRITAEAGTVKTKESERVVPLAAHLLDDPWFSGWVSRVMDGTLPDVAAMTSFSGRRSASDAASKWFKAFRADAKLPAGRLEGTHKFRHWIRSALAAKDVGTETADAITGHAAQGSAGRVSYTLVSLQTMLTALNRLSYPDTYRN